MKIKIIALALIIFLFVSIFSISADLSISQQLPREDCSDNREDCNYMGYDVYLKSFTNNIKDSTIYLTTEAMKEDVDFLVDWIETHQPVAKLIGYSEKQQQIIEDVYKKIAIPLSEIDFYLQINRICTMMGDGHTCLIDSIKDYKTRYLDLPFTWLNDGIYVSNTYKNIIYKDLGSYMLGDKIISIGGKTPEQLIDVLYEQISSENDYWIKANAFDVLCDENFLRYFNLVNDDDTVSIEVKRGDKEFIVRESLISFLNYDYIKNYTIDYEWHIDEENNLGYFRFDNFFSEQDKIEAVKDELYKFFSEVDKHNIENIAIDLRHNKGGTIQIGNYLFKYLGVDKLYYNGYNTYNEFNKYIIPEDAKIFDGNVFVLTSEDTFSCSVFFLNLLHGNGLCYTVGEPTGENPAFNMHGTGSDNCLPNTKWEFIMTSNINEVPGELDFLIDSIYPDIPAYTTIDDLLNGRDTQMNKLTEVINNKETLPDLIELSNKNPLDLKSNRKYNYIISNNNSENFGNKNVSLDEQINIEVKSQSYSSKFKYFVLETDINLKNMYYNNGNVKIYDSSNTEVDYVFDYKIAEDYKNIIIISTYSLIPSGNYVIKIKPLSIKTEDGKYNQNEIIVNVKVK